MFLKIFTRKQKELDGRKGYLYIFERPNFFFLRLLICLALVDTEKIFLERMTAHQQRFVPLPV